MIPRQQSPQCLGQYAECPVTDGCQVAPRCYSVMKNWDAHFGRVVAGTRFMGDNGV